MTRRRQTHTVFHFTQSARKETSNRAHSHLKGTDICRFHMPSYTFSGQSVCIPLQELWWTNLNVLKGVFNEPTSDLTKLLARLVDSKNHILIPKWYSAVRHNTLTPALERLDALNPPEFTMITYRETLGIPELRNEVGFTESTFSVLGSVYCKTLGRIVAPQSCQTTQHITTRQSSPSTTPMISA